MDERERLLGKAPVLFFFLLSGFVLSGSLLKPGGLSVSSLLAYSIRRFFRLYPAVIAAMILSLAAAHFYEIPPSWSPASFWSAGLMAATKAATLKSVVANFLLLKTFFNPPLWTIRVELVCSLLLPMVMIAVGKWRWITIPLLIGLAGAMLLFGNAAYEQYLFAWAYLVPFSLGFLIQSSAPLLSDIDERWTKILLLLLTLLLVIASLFKGILITGSLVLAGLLAVLVPCHWPRLRAILEMAPLRFLGRISFSLYLVNLPLVFLTWRLMTYLSPKLLCHHHPIVPALALFVCSFSVTLPVAAFMERWVEVPFNNLGHRLSKRLTLAKTHEKK